MNQPENTESGESKGKEGRPLMFTFTVFLAKRITFSVKALNLRSKLISYGGNSDSAANNSSL